MGSSGPLDIKSVDDDGSKDVKIGLHEAFKLLSTILKMVWPGLALLMPSGYKIC